MDTRTGNPSAVDRYAIRFDTDAPADMEPTDANLRDVLSGCALPPPHKLLEPVRRAVRALRLDRAEAARMDDVLRAEALVHRPVDGDRFAIDERVRVEYVNAQPGALGAILGRSRQMGGYTRVPSQWWAVELDKPTDSGRNVIRVPERALTSLN